MTDDDYIGIQHAMKMTGKSAGYLRGLCIKGEVECKQVDGEWFIGNNSLYEYWQAYLKFDWDDGIDWDVPRKD